MHTVMFIKYRNGSRGKQQSRASCNKSRRYRRRALIHNFETPGILQGLHNLDKSIESFARACFNYALDLKQDLWFSTKIPFQKI